MSAAGAMALGPDWRRVRALVALRARLALRGFGRDRGALFGAAAFLVISVLGALGVGVFLLGLFRRLPPQPRAELLTVALTALWLLWLAAPVLFFRLNEALDPARLSIYPLTGYDLLIGLLLAALADVSSVPLALLLSFVLLAWGSTPPALALSVAAMTLLVAHLLVASLAVSAALTRLMRHRGTRDLLALLVPVLGSSCYLIQRGASELAGRGRLRDVLASAEPSRYLQFTPPGMAARAIEHAAAGSLPAALLWLLGCGLALVPALALWRAFLTQLMTSETTEGGTRSTRSRRRGGAGTRAAEPAWKAALPPVVRAVALKELRYFWRDPRRKAQVIQTLLSPLTLMAAALLFRPARGAAGPELSAAVIPFAAMFAAGALGTNNLGWEGAGIATLVVTPAPRGHVLLGKNLAVLAVATLPVSVLAALVTTIAPSQWLLPALTAAPATALVAISVANLLSVWLPYRPAEEGRRASFGTGSASRGCLTGTILFAVGPALSVMLLVPVAVAVVLPDLLGVRGWLLVTGLLSLVYAAGMYAAGLQLCARWLERREPEIAAAIRQPIPG